MPARGLTLQRSAIGAYDILAGERRPAHGRWVRMLGRSTNRPTGLKIDLKTARARDGSADARSTTSRRRASPTTSRSSSLEHISVRPFLSVGAKVGYA